MKTMIKAETPSISEKESQVALQRQIVDLETQKVILQEMGALEKDEGYYRYRLLTLLQQIATSLDNLNNNLGDYLQPEEQEEAGEDNAED